MTEFTLAQVDAQRLKTALTQAAQILTKANTRTELLAELTEKKRLMGLATKTVFQPVSRVWQLGVLLLGEDGRLWAAGTTTRAVDPKYPQHHSVSQEQRRAVRAIAYNSNLPEGEVIHYGSKEIPLDAGSELSEELPLVLTEKGLLVKWRPGCTIDQAVEFSSYLAERVDLLINRKAA